jgi:hypothetical protein
MVGSVKVCRSKAWVSLCVFLIFYGAVLITWGPLSRGELNPALTDLGVIPMPKPFADYRVIASAIQFNEAGGDPYRDNRFDFLARTYNYPPLWLHFPFLGVSDESITYVYLCFASFFSLGLFFLFWNDKTKYWYFYFVFLFSPPVFLALERCNYELMVFFLVVLAIRLSHRSKGVSHNILAGSTLLLATMLKIFPVFGLAIFLRESWKRSLTYMIPFGLLSIVYFYSIKPYLALIHVNTQWSQYLSFGVNVVPYYLSLHYWNNFAVYFLAAAWLVVIAFLFLAYRSGSTTMPGSDVDGYDTRLFRVGGIIYIATFLMGNSFDYRLIFLLPTLPWIFRMIRLDSSGRLGYLSYLGCLATLFWLNDLATIFRTNPPFTKIVFFLNEAAGWGTLYGVLVFQFKLLPDFIRKEIYHG